MVSLSSPWRGKHDIKVQGSNYEIDLDCESSMFCREVQMNCWCFCVGQCWVVSGSKVKTMETTETAHGSASNLVGTWYCRLKPCSIADHISAWGRNALFLDYQTGISAALFCMVLPWIWSAEVFKQLKETLLSLVLSPQKLLLFSSSSMYFWAVWWVPLLPSAQAFSGILWLLTSPMAFFLFPHYI